MSRLAQAKRNLTTEAGKRQLRIYAAGVDFWTYCTIKAPDFYKPDRLYLKDICDQLQDFADSDDEVLVLNAPPRHGKSRTISLFTSWIFGRKPTLKVMTGSYNEMLSTSFSKSVRDTIQEVKANPETPVFSDIFPGVQIKRGDAAMNLWSLKDGHNNYLATSPTGTATGFGADLEIIDDLIKSSLEANTDTVLAAHWDWFCFTGETPIGTPEGKKEIKDIGVGDIVLTYNNSQCIVEEKPVVRVGSHSSTIYRLEFENGKTVECTENHQFYTNEGYRSIGEILHTMRCTVEAGQTILFSHLQKQSAGRQRSDNELRKLRERNSTWKEEPANEILFCGLPESITSERSCQPIHWVGKVAGRLKERLQKVPAMRGRRKSTRPSHRSRSQEQPSGKFSGSLPIVPYRLSQITRLPADDIRTVYDIEVTDNHNFFANGLLTHNCNTMLSRLEEGGKIIIVMTRWSTKDLAGKVLEWCKAEGKRYRHISYKAHQGGGKMLCPQILSYKSYLSKASAMSRETVRANYDQEPMDVRGKLYGEFKTYTTLPVDVHGQSLLQDIRSYTDTADEGDDYLCQMIYGVHDKYAYILDIYYTKDPMETTEAECARRLAEWRTRTATIESNNGGRGFARQVRAHLQRSAWQGTEVRTFTQRRNKKARIISNATTVMQRILMPPGWQNRWPEYYDAMAQYQREGTNAHDDAPDTTTGVVEDLLGISSATAQEDRYKAVKALGL